MRTGIVKIESMSVDELFKLASMFSKTELVPKDCRNNPAAMLIKWERGYTLGLTPMESLQSISVINGTPALWGDAMLAICMASSDFIDIEETLEGEGDDLVAICIAKRKGKSDAKRTFSMKNAKRAGLLSKDNWVKYPERMLQVRARGFALRDRFPDKIKGFITVEEAMDIPVEKEVNESPKTVNVASYNRKSAKLADELGGKASEAVNEPSYAKDDAVEAEYTEESKADDNKQEQSPGLLLKHYIGGINSCTDMETLKEVFGEAWTGLKAEGKTEDMEKLKQEYDNKKFILEMNEAEKEKVAVNQN